MMKKYDEAIKYMIQPPKHEYEVQLPSNLLRLDSGKGTHRANSRIASKNNPIISEFKFKNPVTQKLIVGTLFQLSNPSQTPVVIYCHSHGGNQSEGMENIEFLRANFNCVFFDFSGSGKSEGEYCTLGSGEQLDVGPVIDHIAKMYRVKEFYLWGRSMGAVAILKYLENTKLETVDYEICGLVLDSPFRNCKELVVDCAQRLKNIPEFVTKSAIYFVESDIKKKTGYNPFDLDTTEACKSIKDIPAYFMVSKEDYITPVGEINKLYNMYGCSHKQFVKISGFHHTFRKDNELINASSFLKNIAEKRKIKANKAKFETASRAINDFDINDLDLTIPDEEASIKNVVLHSKLFMSNKPMSKRQEKQRQISMAKSGFFIGTENLKIDRSISELSEDTLYINDNFDTGREPVNFFSRVNQTQQGEKKSPLETEGNLMSERLIKVNAKPPKNFHQTDTGSKQHPLSLSQKNSFKKIENLDGQIYQLQLRFNSSQILSKNVRPKYKYWKKIQVGRTR